VSRREAHSQARELVAEGHAHVGGPDADHQPVELVLPEEGAKQAS
jgi:hypothetical protein